MYLQNRLCFELAKMMTKFYDLLCTTQKFIAFMFFTNVCVIWCFTLLFKKDKKQYSFFGAQYFCSYCWKKSMAQHDGVRTTYYEKKVHPKFFQNPFLGCPCVVWMDIRIWSAIESYKENKYLSFFHSKDTEKICSRLVIFSINWSDFIR